jgi:uracil phosphoribosyltransferase
MTLSVLDHALLRHRMAQLRDEKTATPDFRRLLGEIGMILTHEATRAMPEREVEVVTPMQKMRHRVLADVVPVLVPILRAGLGLLEGARAVLPESPVGHLGLFRDEHTLEPHEYLRRLPPDLESREVLVLDPMLATGGSASAAIALLKGVGARRIRFLCAVAAPEGIKRLRADHPDVAIFTAALDERLNERGFILPGLGDAGDRCFGT